MFKFPNLSRQQFLLLIRRRSPPSIDDMIVGCPLVALLWRQSENEPHQVFVAYDKTVELRLFTGIPARLFWSGKTHQEFNLFKKCRYPKFERMLTDFRSCDRNQGKRLWWFSKFIVYSLFFTQYFVELAFVSCGH